MTDTVPAPTVTVSTSDLLDLTPEQLTTLCTAEALVLKVLEKAGKRILKEKRERHGLHRGRPLWTAHTRWPVDEGTARKITRDEWTAFGNVLGTATLVGVEEALDGYTVSILTEGTSHSPQALWAYIINHAPVNRGVYHAGQ